MFHVGHRSRLQRVMFHVEHRWSCFRSLCSTWNISGKTPGFQPHHEHPSGTIRPDHVSRGRHSDEVLSVP
ncbi:MAG: hypothetical protein RIS41_317 [Actinomycetota bacterium]